MKKLFIQILSAMLAVCLLLTAAPLSGVAGLDLFPKAQAYAVGDHIQYGNYPQSRVSDSDTALISNLDAAPKTWKSYRYYCGTGSSDDGKMAPSDYMQFADIFYGGNKYRAVTFSAYRPSLTGDTQTASNFYQEDNGYAPNRIYYFLYEPVSWRILDPADGLILSEMILDSQAYQNTVYYANELYWQDTSASTYASDYATSSIRDWLNYDFYETAFTDAQKNNIRNDVWLNNDSAWSSAYNSVSTKDKIFLLSCDEAKTASYGFSSSANVKDVSRRARGTDYAQCQGLYVYRSLGSQYDGFSWWWLRSPNDSYYACFVSSFGGCSSYYGSVSDADGGVRAACRLANLQSDISQSQNLFSEASGGISSGVSDSCKIPVKNNSVTMALGDKKVLSVSIENPKKQKLLYSSSDPSVVSVSVVGVVTAKSLGTATITVQTYDKAHSVTCDIKVIEKSTEAIPVTGFHLNRHEINLKAYESYQLNYNIEPWNASNRELLWSSSNNDIATIGPYNTVIAKSKGTAVVTLTTADGGYTDAITVHVTGNDLEENAASINYSIGGNTGTAELSLKSNWFLINSNEYNHEMAQLCSRLMMLGYTNSSTIRDAVTGLGFNGKNNTVTIVKLSQPRTSVNYYITSKKIKIDGVINTLVIAGFIGSDHEQWFDNFEPGYDDTHRGFQGAADEMTSILTNYVTGLNVSSEKTKIMIFGHSRGAAVSNLVAASLIHSEKIAPAKSIYTYTFATPSYTKRTMHIANSRIFNFVNPEDFVPRVLPVAWGFGKYGKTYILPTRTNDANWSSILTRLQTSYKKYKNGQKFPASKNGDMNISLAVEALTTYLKNADAYYNKNVVTFGSSILKYKHPLLNRIYTQSIQKSFYTILQESVLKPLAYNNNLKVELKDLNKYMYQNKFTLYDLDNCAQLIFGELGNSVIKALAQDNFNYEEYLESINIDNFVDDTENRDIYYALILSVCRYILSVLSDMGSAHEAQTYATYFDALKEEEVLTDRTRNVCYSRCPVNVEVIDKVTGETVAKIMNNSVDATVAAKNNALVAYVDGDSKNVVLPSNGEYEIILSGNDDGALNYTMCSYAATGEETKRINYWDVPVENDMVMSESTIYDDDGTGYSAIFNGCGEEIGTPQSVAKEDFGALTVTAETEGIGYVSGAGQYTAGDYVTLTAGTDENNSFLGWYLNGEQISTELAYSFVVKDNTSVTAKFTDVTVDLTAIDAEIEPIDLATDAFGYVDVTFTPENATNRAVSFTSSDENVAKVSEAGFVEGVSPGTSQITVTSADGKINITVTVTVTCSHMWDEGEITKPATPTQDGEKTFTCTVCGATRKETVDRLPGAELIDTDTAKEIGDNLYLMPEQTAAALVALAGEGAKLEKADGSAVNGNEIVGSGMTLTKADGKKLTLITKGDNNGDGKITAADARFALRTAVGLEKPSNWQMNASLVAGKTSVTAADARRILRAAVNLEKLKWF